MGNKDSEWKLGVEHMFGVDEKRSNIDLAWRGYYALHTCDLEVSDRVLKCFNHPHYFFLAAH